MSDVGTENADLVDQNHIWYESKADDVITRGNAVYNKILSQLADYIHSPEYATLDGRGIGVLVSASQRGKGIDWNLGTELLEDLKRRKTFRALSMEGGGAPISILVNRPTGGNNLCSARKIALKSFYYEPPGPAR